MAGDRVKDKDNQPPKSSEEEVGLPDTIQDIQLNLNFRYTGNVFLVKVYPKCCIISENIVS